MGNEPNLPDALGRHVKQLGKPVTSREVDTYSKLQSVRDQSHRLRTVVRAWKEQQAQERKLRDRYANLLIWGMGIQVLFINVIIILLGTNLITLEPWTARTFVVSVFAEITALVLVVVKFLFRGPDGSDLAAELCRERKSDE
jgi:hypothetical protein